MYRTLFLSLSLGAALVGCAKRPDQIAAQYTSSGPYEQMSCQRLSEEMLRVSREVSMLTGRQNSAADRDAVATGVGLVLFWPALFFLAGSDAEGELSRVKGEYDAIERARIRRNC